MAGPREPVADSGHGRRGTDPEHRRLRAGDGGPFRFARGARPAQRRAAAVRTRRMWLRLPRQHLQGAGKWALADRLGAFPSAPRLATEPRLRRARRRIAGARHRVARTVPDLGRSRFDPPPQAARPCPPGQRRQLLQEPGAGRRRLRPLPPTLARRAGFRPGRRRRQGRGRLADRTLRLERPQPRPGRRLREAGTGAGQPRRRRRRRRASGGRGDPRRRKGSRPSST